MKFLIIIVLFIRLGILETLGQQPVPNNYTEQSPIDFSIHIKDQINAYSFQFTPDETSFAYKNYNNIYYGIYFRSLLIDSLKEQFVDFQRPLMDYAITAQSNMLYVTFPFAYQLQLHSFNIMKGFIDMQSKIQVGRICQNLWFNSKTKIVLSQNKRMSIFNNTKVYIVDPTTQTIDNLAIDSYSVDYNKLQILDVKWHPTLQEALFIGCRGKSGNNGSFGYYNTTSKEYRELDDINTTYIGFALDGDIILQQVTFDNNLKIYTFQNLTMSYNDQIKDFTLLQNSISSSNGVFAGVTVEKDPNTLKVYKLNVIKNSESKLDIDFSLLFSRQYASMSAFKGISPDGNSIYIDQQDQQNITKTISRFRRCVDGTYLKNGMCYNCSQNCKTCYRNETTCTSCKNPTNYKNYFCLDCTLQFPGCQVCTNITCTQCNQTAKFNSTPQSNKCVCIEGTYLVTGGQSCNYCFEAMAGCTKCSISSFCTQCNGNKHFVLDGKGRCKCADNYVLNGTACIETCSIMPGCLECTTSDNCTKCDGDAHFVINGSNKCQCMDDFWFNVSSCQTCSVINQDCQKCSQDGRTCSQCKSPDRELDPSHTKCVCQDFKYEDAYKNCQFCDLYRTCVLCKDEQTCLQCNTAKGWISLPQNGKCVCQQNYFQFDHACVLCQEQGCIQCNQENVCVKCSAEKRFSLFPINGSCVCQNDTYIDSQTFECFQCKDKMIGCDKCDNLKTCIQCSAQQKFDITPINGSCACSSGTYLDSSARKCSLCEEKIWGCLMCADSTKCTKCDPERNLKIKDDGSGCECNKNYFFQKETCQACSSLIEYCKLCELNPSKQVHCQICEQGFTLNSSTNKCECPQQNKLKDFTCKKNGDTKQQNKEWVMILIIGGSALLAMAAVLIFCKKLKKKKLKLLNDRDDQDLDLAPDEIKYRFGHEEERNNDRIRQQVGQFSDEEIARRQLLMSLNLNGSQIK